MPAETHTTRLRSPERRLRLLWSRAREMGHVAAGDIKPSEPLEKPNFDELLRDVPPELEVSDSRVEPIVKALFAADMPPNGMLLGRDQLPLTDDMHDVVTFTIPRDLPEGAPIESWAIPLPVDSFVYAPDIASWEEARGTTPKGPKGRPSKKYVRELARQPGHTASPVQHVTVCIRPDGTAYSMLSGDGAHRVCAAKLRGDEGIYARGVSVVRVDE